MSIQPLTFTGVSSLSDSLQQVLTRTVNIAKIPLQQLQSQDADLLQKKTLLTGLGSAAATLGDAVRKLGTISSSGALSATSSNPSKVTVQNTGTIKPVAYTLTDISSLAAAAAASTGSFADANKTRVSVSGKVVLTMDDTPYTIDLTGKNTLAGLRDAINKLGAGVTASVLTAGPADNYLSISADAMGKLKSLRLTDQGASDPVPAFVTSTLGSNGKVASATTAKVNDPNAQISATGRVDFTIGGQTTSLDLTGTNSLYSLRDAVDAINGVSATVETDGSQYWLSVKSDSAGTVSGLQLNDETAGELFVTKDLGTNAAAASGTTADLSDATTVRVSTTGSMKLAVGASTYNLTLADNSLTGLQAAIAQSGAAVTATISGSGSAYHLTVTNNATGLKTAFQLTDEPGGQGHELLSKTDLGANAAFKLNGIAMEHKTNTVNDVVPGVTFNILGTTTGTEKVTLNLASDRSQISSAIQSFVSAYNSLQTLVGQQVGEAAGLLTGDGIVRDLQGEMRGLGGYRGEGALKSLADMGMTFDTFGRLSFDSTVFDGLSDSQFQGAMTFFGSSSTGFGALAKRFDTLTDPVTGAIKIQADGYDRTDKRLQSEIGALEDRVNNLQIATAQRLQLADSMLAQLESQQKILNGSIQSANLVLYGRNDK